MSEGYKVYYQGTEANGFSLCNVGEFLQLLTLKQKAKQLKTATASARDTEEAKEELFSIVCAN